MHCAAELDEIDLKHPDKGVQQLQLCTGIDPKMMWRTATGKMRCIRTFDKGYEKNRVKRVTLLEVDSVRMKTITTFHSPVQIHTAENVCLVGSMKQWVLVAPPNSTFMYLLERDTLHQKARLRCGGHSFKDNVAVTDRFMVASIRVYGETPSENCNCCVVWDLRTEIGYLQMAASDVPTHRPKYGIWKHNVVCFAEDKIVVLPIETHVPWTGCFREKKQLPKLRMKLRESGASAKRTPIPATRKKRRPDAADAADAAGAGDAADAARRDEEASVADSSTQAKKKARQEAD